MTTLKSKYLIIAKNILKEKKSKNIDLIINELNKLKYILDYTEILKFSKIFENANKDEIKNIFKEIIKFEKLKYKDYKVIDYFFIKKLNENKDIKTNIKILNKINTNFKFYCNEIEKINNKLLEYIKEDNQLKNYIIIGGYALFIKKTILKPNKDIDLIDLNENAKNLISQKVQILNQNIPIEIFRYDDVFFKEVNMTTKEIRIINNFKIFSDEILIKIALNQDKLNRKNLILIKLLSQTTPIFKNINLDKLTTLEISNYKPTIYPFSLKNNKYILEIFKQKNFLLNITKLEKLNGIYYSNIILYINYVLKDFDYSQKIHNLIYNKILDNRFRSKINVDDRILAMIFFINTYKDNLNFQNKILEDRIYLENNLEIILKTLLENFLQNYNKYRNLIKKVII